MSVLTGYLLGGWVSQHCRHQLVNHTNVFPSWSRSCVSKVFLPIHSGGMLLVSMKRSSTEHSGDYETCYAAA